MDTQILAALTEVVKSNRATNEAVEKLLAAIAAQEVAKQPRPTNPTPTAPDAEPLPTTPLAETPLVDEDGETVTIEDLQETTAHQFDRRYVGDDDNGEPIYETYIKPLTEEEYERAISSPEEAAATPPWAETFEDDEDEDGENVENDFDNAGETFQIAYAKLVDSTTNTIPLTEEEVTRVIAHPISNGLRGTLGDFNLVSVEKRDDETVATIRLVSTGTVDIEFMQMGVAVYQGIVNIPGVGTVSARGL